MKNKHEHFVVETTNWLTKGISEEQFSMIFATLTLIRGLSLSLKRPIEKRFKNSRNS